ncbi:hypothetical protein V493_02895 [Pseudogymnoascus sp. VKM F-4281 (FW-2241)]|nr:hypothetical protein V493_02895 [Pseudogymnoascus sp. VKM F-4281 (FW-2241)]
MVSEETYELCLPILRDSTIEDEDKTDKLEELLKKGTSLTGSNLENAILDILWRHRESSTNTSSPPLMRHTVLRRASPASWQIPRANGPSANSSPRLGVSPLVPPGFVPASFNRNKPSSINSPFTSPRPSPRLNFSSPAIPHSPSLNAYEFPTDTGPTQDIYGDLGSDNVDWIVNDDAAAAASSNANGAHSGLNAAAAEFVQPPQQTDMSPMDMLRSVLGPTKSDEELKVALAMHGYDLSAAIAALMDGQTTDDVTQQNQANEIKAILIGKSMTPDLARPVTPAGQQRNGVVCRFWLSTGSCLRADCRFSHDLSNHICKYWVMGNCLAGDTCIFSHDPSHFMNRLALDGSCTPPLQNAQPNIQFQDANSFPSLQPPTPDQWGNSYQTAAFNYPNMGFTPPTGFKALQGYASDGSNNNRSRPTSRARDTPAAPALDDNEAFPSLGAVSTRGGKKHHGKRGNHAKEPPAPSSLAEVVKMSPSPGAGALRQEIKKLGRNGSSSNMRNGENSTTAQAIPSPQHVPWLETGEKANKAYLKARSDAIKHGGLRNKFLQSAAQAWNRNDARAAKALSLRGQSENDLMRKAHREAARELYESRNKPSATSSSTAEVYVDLHGLHPEEAVDYLEKVLVEHASSAKPVYAITGTGHHSKNGKDKVGKAIRGFLGEWRYAYREFSVPGDRNNVGGILGIDARSFERREGASAGVGAAAAAGAAGGAGGEGLGGKENGEKEVLKVQQKPEDLLAQGHEIGDGKVRMLVREPPKGPAASRAR